MLIFGLCTRTGCALVLIFGYRRANVWAISTAVLSFGHVANKVNIKKKNQNGYGQPNL